MEASNYKNLGIKPFKKGLCDLGNNIYCYLQPDGGWGWSNAGLITDGDLRRELKDYSKDNNYKTLINVAVPAGMWQQMTDIICDEKDAKYF